MAPKKASHLDDPPAASSSEEKEEDSSSEEEEEDPSEDDEQQDDKTPSDKKPKPNPASDSDADSSSDSEPETTTITTAAVAVKPISSKPMDSPKKPRSKPSATPAKRRPADAEPSTSAKRSRKKSATAAAAAEQENGGGASEEEPKKLFQRVFSEEDEIAIMKGVMEYTAKKGTIPGHNDIGAFYDMVKKSIQSEEFTKVQLLDKLRRLKKKFDNNVAKDIEPSKAHEKRTFELSKKIWGHLPPPSSSATPKANGVPATPSKKKTTANSTPAPALKLTPAPTVTVALGEMDSPSANGSASEGGDSGVLTSSLSSLSKVMVARGLALIPEDKKAELKARWKKIHMVEIDLFAKKSELMAEEAKLIFEAIKDDN